MLHLRNLREWEVVEMVIRRHRIVFIILWVHATIGLCINIALYLMFWFELWVDIFSLIYINAFIVFMYIEWINHELDMYVITNSRIVWIEQVGFLNREVSQCALNDVQEVNSKTKWFFANMFNYGDLTIYTSWSASHFKMSFVPDSLQLSRKVLNMVEDYKSDLDKNKRNF
jgi:hypothetical protein